jgi:hypothetical protein
MRIRKLRTGRAWGSPAYTPPEVKIPTTVGEWELYSSMKGCGPAARALASGLNKAIVQLERTVRVNRSYEEMRTKALAAYKAHIEPVLRVHANCGAYDTEPRGIAAGKLATAATKLAGRDDEQQRLAWEF